MPKLIPLSSKKMKEMGIVKSKNGYLMQSSKEKKVVRESNNKPERYTKEKEPKQHIEPVRQSTNNNSSINKVERQQEKSRLENRGMY